jgi:hypothetical protein
MEENKEYIEHNECDKCGKIFKHKYLLIRHINNKTICNTPQKINNYYNKQINILEKKIEILDKLSFDDKIKCCYCNNIFHNKNNLKRHIQSQCVIKINILDEIKKIINIRDTKLNNSNNNINNNSNNNSNNNINNNINNINNINIKNNKIKNNQIINNDNKFDELKEYIKSLEDKIKDISCQIINNEYSNNVNIILNNNKINPYGKEDLSHITNKDYIKYVSKLFPGLLEFIEDVHFSDKMPSNHNIYIPDNDLHSLSVYEKGKWNIKDKNNLINKFISKKISILDKKCNELEKTGQIKDEYVEQYNDFINNYYADEDNLKKKCEDEVELLLYNNRNKIKTKTNDNNNDNNNLLN